MKTLPIFFTLLFLTMNVSGQVTFTRFETGVINANDSNDKQPFGGISGIENLGANNWILVSDRGYYFNCDNCSTISDFQLRINQKEGTKTGHWFESIRFNRNTKTYYYATEYERKDNLGKSIEHTGVYESTGLIDTLVDIREKSIIHLDRLPSSNKGIEAIAITPSGALWVAPEAGWKGETDVGQKYISFYRYKDPSSSTERQEFKYPITRFPEAYFAEDKSGGISEILAIDETHLLVLERCYISIAKDIEIALLRNVTVDEESRELIIDSKDAFNLNTVPGLCNVEGMAWGDDDKKTLYIIADDGYGETYYNDKKIRKTGLLEKPTLRNQLIILRRE
ncbi:esterase-like activity of phytase family protein [Dyadobacter frigoris]|nr:esterase-like activity of phytase family protein [Dyadobacter frigoris]